MWDGWFTEYRASVFMGPVDSGIIEGGIKSVQLTDPLNRVARILSLLLMMLRS
jgi:hypothetical protein